jgi:hypothetical protein
MLSSLFVVGVLRGLVSLPRVAAWLNGCKQQDNEQKKKVRPSRTVHRMRFPENKKMMSSFQQQQQKQ